MEVLLVAVLTASNILCFVLGAKVGQKVVKGEEIQMPTINPLDAYRKHEAKKEAQREQDKFDTILRNIDNYDGTAYGQEEVR